MGSELRFDFGEIRERARLAFRSEGGVWRGDGGLYTSESDGTRISFQPGGPRFGVAPLVLTLFRVGRGAQRFALESKTERRSDGALEIASESFSEVRQNTWQGVHQSWMFSAPPAGKGDLRIELTVRGQTYLKRTAGGLHFVDAGSGVGTRYSHATWVGSDGSRTAVEARFENGRIALRVPNAVLATTHYPAELDPLISPEVIIDAPVPVPFSANKMQVARAGNTYLMVWQLGVGIYGMRFDATTGQALDPAGVLIADTADLLGGLADTGPVVASNGTDFLVVWTPAVSVGATTHDVQAARVRASDGAVLDPNGIPLAITPQNEASPHIIFAGGVYYVAWAESGVVRGTRVSATTGQKLGGTPSTPATPIVSAGGTNVAMASNGSNLLVASDGKGARVNLSTGGVLDSTPFTITGLSSSPKPNWNPSKAAAVFDGTNYFVAWSTGSKLRGARITPAGVVLDPPDEFNQLPGGIDLCQSSGNPQNMLLFANPGGYPVLMWRDNSSFVTRIDTATGSLLDQQAPNCGQSLPLASGFGATLSGGTLFAVAGGKGVELSPDTLAVQQTLDVAYRRNDETQPTVASNGTDFLVAWTDDRNSIVGITVTNVYAARVDGTTGVVKDPTGIALSTQILEQSSPAVASNGKDYLVAWTHDAGGSTSIRAARVQASDGALLDGPASQGGLTVSATTAGPVRGQPAVGSDGVGYMVAYREKGSFGSVSLIAARLDSAGNLLTNTGNTKYITVVNYPDDIRAPAVVADRDPSPSLRTYLLTWTEQASSADPYKVRFARIRAELGSKVDPSGVDLSDAAGSTSTRLGTDGTNMLAVWSKPVFNQYDVYAALIEPANGTVLPGSPFAIATSGAVDVSPTAAHDGNHYYVLWSASVGAVKGILGMRVDDSGSLLDGPADVGGFPINAANTQDLEAAANAQGRVLVAYQSLVDYSGLGAKRMRAQFVQDTPSELDAGIKWDGPWFGTDASDAAPDMGAPDSEPESGSGGAGGGAAGSGTGGASSGGASSGGASSGGAAGTAGSAAGGAAGNAKPPASDDGGCGCRTAPTNRSGPLTLLGVLALVFAVRRRERRATNRRRLARRLR